MELAGLPDERTSLIRKPAQIEVRTAFPAKSNNKCTMDVSELVYS